MNLIGHDSALLQRRLWIQREAERRGCSEKAVLEHYESECSIKKLAACVAVGLLLTILLLAW